MNRVLSHSLIAFALILFGAVASHGTRADGLSTGVKIQTFPEHSRVFIPLDPSVDTQFKPNAKGFEIFVRGISLSDLGAPLGEEAAWENQFSQIRDSRLASLKFAEVSGGVKIQGTWRFPQGAQALANPKMETFDFRQSNEAGTGYVLDFWLKKGAMTLAQYKKYESEQARMAKIRSEEKQRQLLASRRLASEKRKAELEDTTRFCEQPLAESKDIFIQLYPVHRDVNFKRWFPTTTADEYVTYDDPKPEDHSDEAHYVRLALDLYRQGKVALTLKTLDFFDAAHPNSSYGAWMRFLRANAMIKLGLKDKGEQVLRNIMTDSEQSPVALYSAIYLAEKQVERKKPLAATEDFLWLISHFPNYQHAWLFHLGAAESLFALQQTDRALKEYEWVAEKAPDQASRAEGALRAPDLYLLRFQYEQALAGYYQAVHYFPDEAKDFPSVYINRAEALYGLGQYDRAKEAFQAFLKDYPINPGGWRATYRLGEIDGRKGDLASQKSSRDWFYETVNHYPFSPGTMLARLRLLPCGDHGGFDFSAMNRLFDEDIGSYNPSDEVNMVPFHAMATLTHVRTLIALGHEKEAVDLATEELEKPGHLELHGILQATLGSVFRKSILDLLAKGKKYEALAFYKDKASLLAGAAPASEETDYLLKLSQAASDLGLGDLAKELSDAYAKANPARGVADAAAAHDMDTLLAVSEQHFTAAKALWVASGMKEEAAIRAHLGQVHEESPYSYERELILALMDQAAKKPESALGHAVRAQLLRPADASAQAGVSDPRVSAWIAGLQAQAGSSPADWQAALDMYKNLEKHLRLTNRSKVGGRDEVATSLGIPPVPGLDQVVLAQGRLLEKLGRWGEAAATYSSAMNEKLGGDEAIYQYARSLQKTGKTRDSTKAHDILEKLASATPQAQAEKPAPQSGAVTNDNFWKKLAREALADETISKP